MNKNVVVYDPKNEYWEGGIIEPELATMLATRDVRTLPIAVETMRMSGVAGWVKRAWGAGWPVDSAVPQVHCPITLFCTPDYQMLTWIARLQCNPAFLERLHTEGDKLVGQIRLTQDTGQSTPFHVGLTQNSKAVDASELPAPDDEDGWYVGGTARIMAPQDGHYGFGLYGAMSGVRVAWAAVSLAEG